MYYIKDNRLWGRRTSFIAVSDDMRGVVKFTIEGFLLRTKDERDWEWMKNFNYNNKMRKTTSAEAFDSTYTYTHPHTVLGEKRRNSPANNFDSCPYISNDVDRYKLNMIAAII